MTEFVEKCRSEWKRLGVPDPVANEMAADLEADLEEAEAEGVSPEEVVGSGAFDPRSFATAWAAERGVIRRQVPGRHRLDPRLRMPAAIMALVLIAIIGAVLMSLGSPSSPGRRPLALPAPPAERLVITPYGRGAPIFAVDANSSSDATRMVGTVLLTVALTAISVVTLSWLWLGPVAGRAAARMSRTGRTAPRFDSAGDIPNAAHVTARWCGSPAGGHDRGSTRAV